MKTNADVISDFLQKLRTSTDPVDRIELDLTIDALDALCSDHQNDLADLEERVSELEELECEVENVKDERDELEMRNEELADEARDWEDKYDDAVSLLRDWDDAWVKWDTALSNIEQREWGYNELTECSKRTRELTK